jgi:hypothetical protein
MGRKKQEGVTTYPRFRMKAYSVGMGISHGNPELSMDYANAMTQARASGYGIYKNAYAEIKPVLMRNEVPSALWGLYKAFVNEIIAKVQRRKISSIDEVVEKWTKQGLDSAILRECAEAVVEITTEVPPTSAVKGT